MENKKKMAFNVVFLILVFAGTIYGVFHGEDLGEIARILKTVNLLWLIPGFICVIVFLWGESIIIYYMMRTLKIRLKKWTCFLFSSVGFFFSCITPSASGGQPAQIYYMKKEKIPIPVSTLVLMIVTITYKLVLVVVGLWLVLFGQGFIHKYLWSIRHIFYLGTALNVFCVTAMLVLVFHPRLVGGAPDSVFFEKWIQPLTGDADCGSLLLRPSVPWQKRVLEALEHTLEALRQAENGFEFTVRQELSQAVFLLAEKRIARPEYPPDHTGRDGQRMKTMLKFVQEHFAEALTASQIAHSAGLSASECLRCFHAVIGATPMQYVKTFRVQQAAQLLEGTDWPVAKVGRQCGFKEMGYFARAFREMYHCTPTEHRRAILQKKAGGTAIAP